MSMTPDLAELADRVEKLTGPCRETDALIACQLCNGKPDYKGRYWKPGVRGFCIASPYTASIDAAMWLVPEGWWIAGLYFCPPDFRSEGDREWHAQIGGPITWADMSDIDADEAALEPQYECQGGNAATPALALCGAALRARLVP